MPSPSYEERICAMFDAFSKKVSRNFIRDLQRKEKNQNKHISQEPMELLLELIGSRDRHPSEHFVLYADGLCCSVNDESLYDALKSLSDKQSTVLLLDFWYGFTDKEIAKRLEVTPRTVYN